MKIQNSDAIDSIRESARLSISEGFPTELSSTVVPILDMTPKKNKAVDFVISGTNSSSGAFNLVTFDSGKDFYLTSLNVAYVKDATCNVATGTLNIGLTTVVGGIVQNIFLFPVITTTAQEDFRNVSFNPPIRIKGGTSVTFSGTFTLGVMVRVGGVTGYYLIP